MSTLTLWRQHTAAATVYFSLFDMLGRARDFADDTWKALASHAINAVTVAGAGSAAIRVATDITSSLTVGKKIRVRGSTGNDAVYTIRSGSAFAGGNTTINVDEAVSDATVDGTVDLNATPFLAATERTGPGGAASVYTADVDLLDLHNHGAIGQYIVYAFSQAGADPVPASDTVVGSPEELVVQFGEVGRGTLSVAFDGAFTTTAGTTLRLIAALQRNGVRIELETIDPAATCALAVREHGSGSDLFTISATTVNADGIFELSKATPGYTADRVYGYTITIVENGNTHTFFDVFPVHG